MKLRLPVAHSLHVMLLCSIMFKSDQWHLISHEIHIFSFITNKNVIKMQNVVPSHV